MTSIEKKLSSEAIVRFQHCDPLGHLNNSMYIDYFLNAREDQLSAHYQLDIYQHSKTEGKAWVVAAHQILYKRPVNALDKIVIESALLAYDNKSLKVKFEMKKEEIGLLHHGDLFCLHRLKNRQAHRPWFRLT